MLGLGATAALAGGLGFGIRAQRDSQTVAMLQQGSNPDRLSLSNAEDLHARGRNAEALQIAFITTGAAVAAAGTAMLVVGLVKRRRGRTETVSANFRPQTAAIQAAWRF